MEDRLPNLTYAQSAAAVCKSRGGMLANLKDAATDTLIRKLIMDNELDDSSCIENKGFFIGLNDKTVEGTYVWSDGTEVNRCNPYTNWATGEPNDNEKQDTKGQDCVQLWFRGNRQGKWDDEYCDYRPKGFVCEIPNTCCCDGIPEIQ
ncbi:low affinity immunoglobulin epsilon Fc receptor-like [Glandiceps talaboti]